MALGFSIGNMFRPTQQVAPAPTQQPQPGQQAPTQQSQVGPANGANLPVPTNVPNLNPAPDNQTQDNSPLAPFAKMWETDPTAKPPTDPWSQPILPSDPAQIQAAAKTMNMMQGVDPALMARATAGNDPAAFLEVMNAVSQNTLAMAAQLTTATVEKAGSTIRSRQDATLEEKFRDFTIRNLSTDNPVLNNPAVQPMLVMARQQIKQKNPGWSPQQVQDEAVKYLNSFASAMSGQTQQASQVTDQTGTPEQDWSKFL